MGEQGTAPSAESQPYSAQGVIHGPSDALESKFFSRGPPVPGVLSLHGKGYRGILSGFPSNRCQFLRPPSVTLQTPVACNGRRQYFIWPLHDPLLLLTTHPSLAQDTETEFFDGVSKVCQQLRTFLMCMRDLSSSNTIDDFFRLYDTEGTGSLTKDEFTSVLRDLHLSADETVLEAVYQRYAQSPSADIPIQNCNVDVLRRDAELSEVERERLRHDLAAILEERFGLASLQRLFDRHGTNDALELEGVGECDAVVCIVSGCLWKRRWSTKKAQQNPPPPTPREEMVRARTSPPKRVACIRLCAYPKALSTWGVPGATLPPNIAKPPKQPNDPHPHTCTGSTNVHW